MPDYIPEADGAFDQWLTRLAGYAVDHAAELPLTPAERQALSDAADAFAADRAAHEAARLAAATACRRKDDTRQGAESVARVLVRKLQADPDLTDTRRAGLGIPIRRPAAHREDAPGERPRAVVERIEPLRHRLRVLSERGETLTRKPQGVIGAEIWARPAGSPGDEPLQFLGLATDGTFVADYSPSDRGAQIEYRPRWVDARGRRGPWGPAIAATVAA